MESSPPPQIPSADELVGELGALEGGARPAWVERRSKEVLADYEPTSAASPAYSLDLDNRHGQKQVKRLTYSHMAMAEAIMANPSLTNSQLGAMFGRTSTWVSIVKGSDAFKTFYAARYAELADPELSASIKDRFQAMTERGLRVLQEKLEKPAAEVSDNLVLRAVELGAKALAVGGNAPPPPPPNAADYLPELTERLLRLGARVRNHHAVDANIVGEG